MSVFQSPRSGHRKRVSSTTIQLPDSPPPPFRKQHYAGRRSVHASALRHSIQSSRKPIALVLLLTAVVGLLVYASTRQSTATSEEEVQLLAAEAPGSAAVPAGTGSARMPNFDFDDDDAAGSSPSRTLEDEEDDAEEQEELEDEEDEDGAVESDADQPPSPASEHQAEDLMDETLPPPEGLLPLVQMCPSPLRPQLLPPLPSRPKTFLDRSILFRGTSSEVRRALTRSIKASLWGLRRRQRAKSSIGAADGTAANEDGERSFKILVLGGSVSNCRGVDPEKECWHSRVATWFKTHLPLEGDYADLPALRRRHEPELSGGPRADLSRRGGGDIKAKMMRQSRRKVVVSTQSVSSFMAETPPEQTPTENSSDHRRMLKRQVSEVQAGAGRQKREAQGRPAKAPKRPAAPAKKKVVAAGARPKKKGGAGKNGRAAPTTQLINLSKSATGSAFFAYCLAEEATTRKKDQEPDLVILEFGINDVWPAGASTVSIKAFERLLMRLRSFKSKPAIVILEAASLLLAQTTSVLDNAEWTHLPAAQFFDVPVLSAKTALFGPTTGLPDSSFVDDGEGESPRKKMEGLFLPDLHHPNDKGHAMLADIVIDYLQDEACHSLSEIQQRARARYLSQRSDPSAPATTEILPVVETARAGAAEEPEQVRFSIDPALDIPSLKAEKVLELPWRSLFDPFDASEHKNQSTIAGAGTGANEAGTCLMIGNEKADIKPKKNNGWTRYAWARDKQYLIASQPGSRVTFDIIVGPGGEILVDWLRSRFYDLGNVLVWVDGDRKAGKSIAGWWDLGWSIGVPTTLFSGVPAGPHTVTFELLPSTRSSHPLKKTSFRLLGLIAT